MIAIPLPLLVEWNDEEIAPLQRLQPRAASLLPRDSIAERTGQSVENCSLKQEAARFLRLPLQDLVDQIIDDVPVVSREGRNEAGHVVVALQGQRGQLESRNPAL